MTEEEVLYQESEKESHGLITEQELSEDVKNKLNKEIIVDNTENNDKNVKEIIDQLSKKIDSMKLENDKIIKNNQNNSNAIIRKYKAGENLETGDVVELYDKTVVKSKLKSYNYKPEYLNYDAGDFFKIECNLLLRISQKEAEILSVTDTTMVPLSDKIIFDKKICDEYYEKLKYYKIDNYTFLLIFYCNTKIYFRILKIDNKNINILYNAYLDRNNIERRYTIAINKINDTKLIMIYTDNNNDCYGRIININNNIEIGESYFILKDDIYWDMIFENNVILISFFKHIVALSINNTNIKIIDKKYITKLRNSKIFRLNKNKYIRIGTEDHDDNINTDKGYMQIIKFNENNIVIGNKILLGNDVGSEINLIKISEHKIFISFSSTNYSTNSYISWDIFNIDNMNIIKIANHDYDYKQFSSCFDHNIYQLNSNMILWNTCYYNSATNHIRLCYILNNNLFEKKSISKTYSRDIISPKMIRIDLNRFLIYWNNSKDQTTFQIVVIDNMNIDYNTKFNNNILGVATEDVQKNTNVNILLKGIYTFDNLKFEEGTNLNNVDGKLKASYTDTDQYAISLDENTIEILKPYSKDNTI